MLCLAAGAVVAPLLTDAVTLTWTHSVERTLWEEDWRSVSTGLELAEARIRGSGAGMDPPPQARRVGEAWAWRPALPAQPELVLRRSGATADWRICIRGSCQALDALVPADADPVTLRACNPSP